MPSDKLTELGIHKAKPSSKQRKLTDGRGLFLLLHPNGSKYWRMKYQFMGKEKLLAFGVWPEVSLTEACKKRNEAKLILKSVNDPSVDKKNQKLTGHILQNNNFGFLLRLVTPSPVIAPLILHSQTLSTTIFIKNRVKIRFIANLCFSP